MTRSTSRTLETVVLVEDDADIRIVATAALESIGGFRVIACRSGEEALRTIPQVRPDLVLLDVVMPGLDGPQTLTQLAEAYDLSETAVVFMTGRVKSEEIKEYLALGAAGVVTKPFDPMGLADQVQGMWDRHLHSPGS
ncbi:MAG: response regulator [Deltaproteobacteria bacterium]|nr:response regulator [Deltaproteobacteria bacterium]